VHNHDDQFDSATSRKTQEVLTACRQVTVLPFIFPKLQDCRFKNSKILGFKKGGIAGNPEFRNSGITITNSNNAVF